MADILSLIEVNVLFEEAFAEIKTAVRPQHIAAFGFVCEADQTEEILMKDVQNFIGGSQVSSHRALTAMEQAGLFSLERSNMDARQVRVSATPKGLRLLGMIESILKSDNSATQSHLRARIKEATNNAAERAKLRHASQSDEWTGNRKSVSNILKYRESGELVEVGSNYVKTKRGAVTLRVLMKRSKAYSIEQMGKFVEKLSDAEYDAFLTPNPRTTEEREQRAVIEALEKMKGEI